MKNIKNEIINKISLELETEERIVSKVIEDSFSKAKEAMLTNNSIEISGLGCFLFKEKTARNGLKKYTTQLNLLNKKIEKENLTNKVINGIIVRNERFKEIVSMLTTRLEKF